MVTRIVPEFVVQFGDAGSSIFGDYGQTFYDEKSRNLAWSNGPARLGDVYYCNRGVPDSNCDQFFVVVTTDSTDLDTFVKFGRVVQGIEHVRFLETFGTSGGQVTKEIRVSDCGEIAERDVAFDDVGDGRATGVLDIAMKT
eukprot:g3630.t1